MGLRFCWKHLNYAKRDTGTGIPLWLSKTYRQEKSAQIPDVFNIPAPAIQMKCGCRSINRCLAPNSMKENNKPSDAENCRYYSDFRSSTCYFTLRFWAQPCFRASGWGGMASSDARNTLCVLSFLRFIYRLFGHTRDTGTGIPLLYLASTTKKNL